MQSLFDHGTQVTVRRCAVDGGDAAADAREAALASLGPRYEPSMDDLPVAP